MIEIGKYNKLRIRKEASQGLYLVDELDEEVLLPNKYCPEDFEINDKIEVFVYLDYTGQKIATNITPKILLNEFSLLQVTAVTEIGTFMDWGLEKELFVPFREQRFKMEEGRWYIVYLDLDTETDRLYGSNQIENLLQNEELHLTEGEKVKLLILKKTDLGFTAIVNNEHKGLLFENEIFRELNIGDKLDGYVKKIREDHKIDISLQPIGYDQFNDANAELVYNTLSGNDGFIAITDKSSPDEIYVTFGISKKAFKKSLGALYKQRKIIIESTGIKLI
ncbi:MAG: GntR family transcriptional regulator [Bacteroidetes bacterium]|nr:GntR family transcriptional regulator [Bacteroidota bacterium]